MTQDSDPSPGQPESLPMVSPDGRFGWDGHRWVPTPGVSPVPPGRPKWVKTAAVSGGIALLAFMVIGAAMEAMEGKARSKTAEEPFTSISPWGGLDCDLLAAEAVRISQENDGLIHLLDVRLPTLEEDLRDTYVPPTGAGESKVMSCTGTGVFDSGAKWPVRIVASVDADGDMWVFSKPTRK